MGIEPTYLAWKASVLPLNYTCVMTASLCGQCPKSESNQRHEDFQSSALPTELSGHLSMEQSGIISNYPYKLCSISDINNFTRFLQYCQDEI